jgi:hypothetical protein
MYLCKTNKKHASNSFYRLRTKRTGIAVTDEMKIIASGLTTASATAIAVYKFIIRAHPDENTTCSIHNESCNHFSNFPDMKVIRWMSVLLKMVLFSLKIDSGFKECRETAHIPGIT